MSVPGSQSDPNEIAEQCSHPGDCYDDVKYWQEKLNFMAPRQQMIEYLRPFGAWSPRELNAKKDCELAQTILWIAAGEIKDNDEWFGLIH